MALQQAFVAGRQHGFGDLRREKTLEAAHPLDFGKLIGDALLQSLIPRRQVCRLRPHLIMQMLPLQARTDARAQQPTTDGKAFERHRLVVQTRTRHARIAPRPPQRSTFSTAAMHPSLPERVICVDMVALNNHLHVRFAPKATAAGSIIRSDVKGHERTPGPSQFLAGALSNRIEFPANSITSSVQFGI